MRLSQLAADADVVSIHARSTPETHQDDRRRILRLMKPTAILVNTFRGGLIDQAALVQASRSTLDLGAGLDVREIEPISATDPLMTLSNCGLAAARRLGLRAVRATCRR